MNLNLGMNLLTEPAPTTWVIIKGTSYVWQNLAVYRFELSDVQLACSVVTVHMDINREGNGTPQEYSFYDYLLYHGKTLSELYIKFILRNFTKILLRTQWKE